MNKRVLIFIILVNCFVSVLFLVLGMGAYELYSRNKKLDGVSAELVDRNVLTDNSEAVISLVDGVSDGVVSIVGRNSYFDKKDNFFPYGEPAIGTGFVIDSEGVIVTNEHVVHDDSLKYFVVFNNGDYKEVKEIHADTVYDIAFLEIESGEYNTLEIGDSNNLKVGQPVVAIGNQLGELANSATVGVVSGMFRNFEIDDPYFSSKSYYANMIQTDAAINPGNSGGPLLDLTGRVIGVNVASSWYDNVSFTIPANILKKLVDSYKDNGKIEKPYLGIKYMPGVQYYKDGTSVSGEKVLDVDPTSPAAKFGLKKDDIITDIDGKKIDSKYNLDNVLLEYKKGDKISLKVFRDMSYVDIEVTLGKKE